MFCIFAIEEPTTIKAHKVLLISASPVFEAMFCGPMQENGDVTIADIDAITFKTMLR